MNSSSLPNAGSAPGIIGQLPRLAVVNADEAVSGRLTDNPFLDRVPGDFLARTQGDISQVRDTGDMVADFEVFHRPLARLDTVQEVPHVGGAGVSFARFFVRREALLFGFRNDVPAATKRG